MASEVNTSLVQSAQQQVNATKSSTQVSKDTEADEAQTPDFRQMLAEADAMQEDQAAETEPKELSHAVSDLNDIVQSMNRELHFSIDDSTNDKVVIQVKDSGTGDVIRQIPSEEALKLAQTLHSAYGNVGHIFEDKA